MNYTLNQLRIYLKVAQTLNITKAAEELNLTQPAVSIQLKNFQDQFDVPLIEVLNKKLYITEFGHEIVQAAAKIIEEVHAIDYKMHAYKGHLTGKLKLTVASTGKYIAPFFISDFMKQHQGIELTMDVTNKAQVLQSLEKNEVDFALVSVLPEKLNIEKIELLQNKLYLVGYTDNSTTPIDPHDKKLFERIPLIYREQGSATRQLMERYIKRNNLVVLKKMELTSNEAVKQAVIAGLGYSIMPIIGIKNELINNELKIIPFDDFPIKSMWHLIWLKEKKLTPVAKAYLQYVQKEKENIRKEKFDWFEKF